MTRFFYGAMGGLLCDERLQPDWRQEGGGRYSYIPEAGAGAWPRPLYLIAESMSEATARMLAEALGGKLEVPNG
jgi:hypothetical protein